MKANRIMTVLFCLVAIGCSTTTTVVKTLDTRPSIMITGAPLDSILLVDGLDMGKASQYDGKPNVLILESGTHKVSIILEDNIVFEQVIFVDSERKEIKVK